MPHDPERDAELELIAADIRRSYAAAVEEFPQLRASIEADLHKKVA